MGEITPYSGVSISDSALAENKRKVWDEMGWTSYVSPVKPDGSRYCEIKVEWKHYSLTRKFDTRADSIGPEYTIADWITANQNNMVSDILARFRDGVWR